MKKLTKLSLIVLIPLISGIVLLVAGGASGNEKMVRVGELILSYGLPITMFSLVVLALVLMITGRLSDNGKQDDDTPATREQEASDIDAVNSSRGYESHRKSDAFMIRHVANNYKNASPKEKILGWLFFGYLMTVFFLILVFIALRNVKGVLVCFCLFGGTIFVSIIVKVILEKTSMRVNAKKLDGKEVFKGVVTASVLSSTASTGGSNRRHTTHIVKVVYRVLIERDGEQYTAYSDNFYEEGDEVFFVVRHRSLVSIVDADKVRKENDTNF